MGKRIFIANRGKSLVAQTRVQLKSGKSYGQIKGTNGEKKQKLCEEQC